MALYTETHPDPALPNTHFSADSLYFDTCDRSLPDMFHQMRTCLTAGNDLTISQYPHTQAGRAAESPEWRLPVVHLRDGCKRNDWAERFFRRCLSACGKVQPAQCDGSFRAP